MDTTGHESNPKLHFITVGRVTAMALSPLIESLESRGFRHLQACSMADLERLAAEAPGAPIVVYNAGGHRLAQSVLETIGQRCCQMPVIVVVSTWNLDDHYALLCHGAYDYFALSEGLGAIESAVQWAIGRGTGALWVTPGTRSWESTEESSSKLAG